MARRPHDEPLRERRVSIMRDKVYHLGRVVAADREAAIDRAMEKLGSNPRGAFA